MKNNDYRKVVSYFSKKATQYDLVDKQSYWNLSDRLLEKIIGKKINDVNVLVIRSWIFYLNPFR